MKKLAKRYVVKAVPINMKEQLILDYTPLVRFIAHKIISRLPPSIEVDDLMSAGILGLMDAIEKYDACRDNRFKTYAEFRIKGAIIDELRAQDWIPRSIREKIKAVDKASSELEQKMKRKTTAEEISGELGLSIDQFHIMLNKIHSSNIMSLDEENFYENFSVNKNQEYKVNSKEPLNKVLRDSTRSIIFRSISTLPSKQKLVLSLYYFEDLNLREIGSLLEVTESRISQLHTRGLCALRKNLERYKKIKGDL